MRMHVVLNAFQCNAPPRPTQPRLAVVVGFFRRVFLLKLLYFCRGQLALGICNWGLNLPRRLFITRALK